MKTFKKFMDALSLTFPKGETYFQKALRNYENILPLNYQLKFRDFQEDEIRHVGLNHETN